MFCPGCGKPRAGNAGFCTACGYRYPADVTVSRPAPVGNSASEHHVLQADDESKWNFKVSHDSYSAVPSIANDFSIHPPPPLPDPGSDAALRGRNTDIEELHRAAAVSGYRFYDPAQKDLIVVTENKKELIYSIISMVFVFVMLAGMPFYSYSKMALKGKKVQTPLVDVKFMFTINYLPPGWKMIDNPAKKAGDPSAQGFFYKGSLLKPDIRAIVYSVIDDSLAPEYIQYEMYGDLEEYLVNMNEYYMDSLGMEYELLDSKLLQINNQITLRMEGNGKCKSCDNIRDFTYIVLCPGRYYLIKFLFNEKNLDEYWPEISDILEGIEFH